MNVLLVATKDVKFGDVTIKANDILAVATHDKDDVGVFKFSESAMAQTYAAVTNARLVVVDAGAGKTAISLASLVAGAAPTADAEASTVYKAGAEYTKIAFPAYDPDKSDKTISRDVRASTEMIRRAERAGRTGAITIEVGQVATLGDYVKYGPSNANTGKSVNTPWAIDYYNSAATEDDFAVLNEDGKKVMGVAVGRVKAVTTFEKPDGTTLEVEVPINVVARGASSKPETPVATTESATLAIGGTYWAESGNENTEWTVDNDNVTIVPEKGAGCKIFAKKAGTATVTGTVDGEVVKTVNVTITAAGATTPDVPTEANPSTGDSLLAFLF